jgi:hypothetical protein
VIAAIIVSALFLALTHDIVCRCVWDDIDRASRECLDALDRMRQARWRANGAVLKAKRTWSH